MLDTYGEPQLSGIPAPTPASAVTTKTFGARWDTTRRQGTVLPRQSANTTRKIGSRRPRYTS